MRLISKVTGYVDDAIWFLNQEPEHEVDGTDKNVMDPRGGNDRCVAECHSGDDIPWPDFAWTPQPSHPACAVTDVHSSHPTPSR